MKPFQQTYISLDELRQIQLLARRSQSIDELRQYFERVQSLRRTHLDDFDLQVFIAEIHEEIVERARALRDENEGTPYGGELAARIPPRSGAEPGPVSSGPEPLDPKTWRHAMFIGLFFTVVVLAAFFYLIQAARKSNLLLPESPVVSPANAGGKAKLAPAANAQPAPNPILRLYTDLVPGTASIDGGPPADLKDGELVLDRLPPGRHTIRVAGHSGNATFTYEVSGKTAPAIIGVPSASNAMAVLVSTDNGNAYLVTNAENSNVLLDGRAAGHAGPGGLT
ncbi:MAG: hypothetical protein ACRD4O_18015, partial [Bryobacteraceae bacterium]